MPRDRETDLPRYAAPGRPLGAYPRLRARRNRRAGWTRALVAESRLGPQDFIWPLFVVDGEGVSQPVSSMPGVCRWSVELLVERVREAGDAGIPAVALFPYVDPALKTHDGEHALDPENIVCRAIRAVKAAAPEMGVVCDVALDPFTTHGQDGIVRDGRILNDETVHVLCEQARVQVEAGCDVIAPSDMMDGRVGAIRDTLDAAGREDASILAYSAKYASAFYGPFRDAVGSAGALGAADKKTYQMDPANTEEALREIAADLAEGADMVMVKPGLPYLDVIRRVKERFGVPTVAYNVSGEYSMLKAAGERGWLDYDLVLLESLMAFKRAGADAILTYAAMEACALLAKE